MSISYYHIDSFASELFAGNPAGVCVVPAFPVDDVMQKIAAENGHSETAFVVARAAAPDFDLRWFTPAVEDDLCGHATLAAAYALSLPGHDTWTVRLHTISGVLTVNRDCERFKMDVPSRPARHARSRRGCNPALRLDTAEVLHEPRSSLSLSNTPPLWKPQARENCAGEGRYGHRWSIVTPCREATV